MIFSIHQGTLDEVLRVDAQIPEFDGRTTLRKLQGRLANKKHLILIAKYNGMPIGYKLGYQQTESEFYSWLGGISPDFRKKGIATKLRETQERWAKQNGYAALTVKSMNRYPAMLQLLISSGYAISGYEDNGSVELSKIMFIKTLVSSSCMFLSEDNLPKS